ncbi:MAG: hypothetical protein QOJ85_1909, partial [Solirubrobacteraceae bacterium]|nr:hypothetical protein [Solirubrobacteraceae bacterium]
VRLGAGLAGRYKLRNAARIVTHPWISVSNHGESCELRCGCSGHGVRSPGPFLMKELR